ncbi:MAG: zinc-ribbon domain-containing protein [Eubacterium sp.]
MYCKQCGKEMNDGAEFCPNCGAKNTLVNTTNYSATPVGNKKTSTLAIVALVLAVVGFAIEFFIGKSVVGEALVFFGFIVSIVALRKPFKADQQSGFVNFFKYAFRNVNDSRSHARFESITFVITLLCMIIDTVLTSLL